MAQLAHRFEQNNPDRRRQVEAPRSPHGNRQQLFGVLRQQGLGQAFGFPAEDQKIAGLERHVVVGAIRFCREKEEASRRFPGGVQFLERIPELDVDFLPVIEAGAFQRPVVDGESERLNKVKSGAGGKAKPPDVARVRRNLRLDEDDVKRSGVLQRWSNGVMN
jgi:hypothetical protein